MRPPCARQPDPTRPHIAASWDGASVGELAQSLGCHPKTVYKWLHRFNQAHGIDGLADLPRPGLPRRITETERGRIIQLARAGEDLGVYGALRVGDGQEVTMTAPSRNSIGYQQLLAAVETANPAGTIMVITDNLSSHTSVSTRAWLADHPRIHHTFIPKGACWLNLQEGWWRLFRRQALAGQCFATPEEITLATKIATCQLNARARPWVWGRPPPSPRHRRHALTYRI
jgi:transposase